jgi:hypothetical protein
VRVVRKVGRRRRDDVKPLRTEVAAPSSLSCGPNQGRTFERDALDVRTLRARTAEAQSLRSAGDGGDVRALREGRPSLGRRGRARDARGPPSPRGRGLCITPTRAPNTSAAPGPPRPRRGSALFDFIESFYNRRRRYPTLGYLSPAEYEKISTETKRDQTTPCLSKRGNSTDRCMRALAGLEPEIMADGEGGPSTVAGEARPHAAGLPARFRHVPGR